MVNPLEGVLLFCAHFTGKQREAQEDESSTANQERDPRPQTGTAQCVRPQTLPLGAAVHACMCWGKGDAQRPVPTKATLHGHCPIPGLTRQSRETSAALAASEGCSQQGRLPVSLLSFPYEQEGRQHLDLDVFETSPNGLGAAAKSLSRERTVLRGLWGGSREWPWTSQTKAQFTSLGLCCCRSPCLAI